MKNILVGLIMLLGFQAFTQSKITNIKLEKTPCFGSCPSYRIEIKRNGEVYFQGLKNALYDGTIKGTLSVREFNKLVAKYKKYNFQKLSPSYKVTASDLSKAHLNLLVNGKSKTIKNANEGPDYLQQFCIDVEALLKDKISWDKKSFVKRESKPDTLLPEIVDIKSESMAEVIQIDPEFFVVVEQMPEFPGGSEALMSFIQNNIMYPSLAKEQGVQGKVFCSFIVNADGSISNTQVLRGIGSGCDEEAIRVIKKMPNWKPGKQNGRAVRVKVNLPFAFHIK